MARPLVGAIVAAGSIALALRQVAEDVEAKRFRGDVIARREDRLADHAAPARLVRLLPGVDVRIVADRSKREWSPR